MEASGRLELLWGDGQRPRRGPKPALSIETIADAAIALADEQGLSAMSMRALAERLGFTTMSLYRYLPGKSELLELMLDQAMGAPPGPDAAPAGWRPKLEAWARSLHEVYTRHPWVLQVPLSAPLMGPNRIGWLEAGLEALSDTGLPAPQRPSAVLAVDGYVRGAAQISIGTAQTEQHSGLTEADWQSAFTEIIERAVADERFPHLAANVAAGGFSDPAGADGDFEFGLDRLLDGIAELVSSPSL